MKIFFANKKNENSTPKTEKTSDKKDSHIVKDTEEHPKPTSKKKRTRPESELIYQFETLEFTKHERGIAWYITFSTISILLLSYAIITRSPMTFLVFLLCFILVLIVSNKDPQKVTVSITADFIQFDKRVIPYSNVEFFGILYFQGNAFISLFLKNGMDRYIKIPLGAEDPEDIGAILSVFLERKDGQENLVDNLDQLLKL
jgi:hypothetical protein